MQKLIIAASVVFMLGCSTTHKQLERLYSTVHDYPDSTLAELEGFVLPYNVSQRDRADYSLLMSMVFDKCYIDIASDSLIRPAVQFYSSHKPKEKEMLSYYYLGRVQSNANDYLSAAISFDRAEDLSKEVGNYLYLGLAERNLASIHGRFYDNEHAIEYLEKALEAFSFSGQKIYVDHCAIMLANYYANNKMWDKSLAVFKEILENDTIQNSLKPFLYSSYAATLIKASPEYAQEAVDYYEMCPRSYLDAQAHSQYGYALSLTKRYKESESAMQLADSLANLNNSFASIVYFKYLYHKKRGEMVTADSLLVEAMRVEDIIAREKLNQSINFAEKQYYRQEANDQIRKKHTLVSWFTFGLITLSILLLLLIVNHRIKIRNEMAKIQELNAILSEEKRHTDKIINTVLTSQLSDLELLSNEYYMSDSFTQREKYYHAFSKRIEEFRNYDSDLVSLEDSVNNFKDGCMALLRKEYPNQGRYFYRMCTLFFAGFPYDLISLLTSASISTIKTGKSKIKKKLIASDCLHKELFLTLLDCAEKRPSGRPRKN